MQHPSYSQTHEPFVRAGIVLTAVIMAGFALAEWVVSIGTISLAISAVLLLVFSHFPRNLEIEVRGAVAIVYITCVLALHTYLNGGVYAAALHVAPVIPLFAVLNGPRRLARWLTAAVFIGIQLVLAMHLAGYAFPTSTQPHIELLFGVEATAIAVVMAFLLAQLYDESVHQAREERENVNRQLRSQQRLASMGTLAAGVAHEINNPLTIVLSNMTFVREELEGFADETVVDAVLDSIDGAARIARIVKQLGLLGEKSEDLVAERVTSITQDVVRLTSQQTGDVRVVVTVDDLPPVLGPPELLRQVFVNLVVNAAQAIGDSPGHHEIWIRSGPVTEQKLEIWVEDTGPGIATEHLESIFDPFFTTKKVWEGQGLGLAVVAQILADSGGGITVENIEPHGARFKVSLPRATDGRPMANTSGEFALSLASLDQLAILIVDDEHAVTRALERSLREHAVTSVHSGDETLRLLERSTAFDLILMDLSMPQMSGIELSQAVLKRHPMLAERLVFLTGGAVDERTRDFVQSTTQTVLYKPVDAEKLARVIGDLPQRELHTPHASTKIDPGGIARV